MLFQSFRVKKKYFKNISKPITRREHFQDKKIRILKFKDRNEIDRFSNISKEILKKQKVSLHYREIKRFAELLFLRQKQHFTLLEAI